MAAKKGLLAAVLLLSLLSSPLPSRAQASSSFPVNVWPKPTSMSWAEPLAAMPVSASFRIVGTSGNSPYLVSATQRYTALLFAERYRPIVRPAVNVTAGGPALQSLTVSVSDLSAPLQDGVDESYALEILPTGVATITAATVWAAMHGLETFSQLAWRGRQGELLVAAGVRVEDKPLYQHRGLMLDTGRTYFPVVDILRTIDTMAANKMNVFHWHITDSQSFPIELPSEPMLAEMGAYGEDMRYTVKDVKRIVEFAMSRGVRVVPEIDAPGHTASWAGAYPEAVSCAGKFWLPDASDWGSRLAAEPGSGQLNPLEPKTYEVMTNIINDLTSLFPEGFYHAGADEVTPGCWETDPSIQADMEKGGTLSQLLEHYVRAAGYRAIVSSASFYYLDCGHGDFVGNNSVYDDQRSDYKTDGGSWCGPFKTWQRVYDYDIAYNLTAEEAKLVIGGEVALWTEQADSTVLDARIWPRASAMAEALWSGNRDASGRKRYAEATDRLNDWRHRMVGRGIRAEPIQPLWCRTRPGMCDMVR
ncbi:beta-hexosaminidase 2-like [Triticum dicoccoides]|uniref:beta-hexosaminidase 2-like n=1 Tax=Triticum dicoccoides TaxID=85692 RepID=UPI00188E167A|nr:beta-hexosaminidase 2-like [Triticum dicoccoides]